MTESAASDDATATGTAERGDANPIQVTGATMPADWVREGYDTSVQATVVNTANRTANRTLTVTVDDRPVSNATVTLGPNERDVVTIEFEPVSGTVAVAGVEAGRIDVGERRRAPVTETDDTSGVAGSDGGFSRVVLIASGLVVAGGILLGLGVVVTGTLRRW